MPIPIDIAIMQGGRRRRVQDRIKHNRLVFGERDAVRPRNRRVIPPDDQHGHQRCHRAPSPMISDHRLECVDGLLLAREGLERRTCRGVVRDQAAG